MLLLEALTQYGSMKFYEALPDKPWIELVKVLLSLTDRKSKDPNQGKKASISGDLTLLAIWC